MTLHASLTEPAAGRPGEIVMVIASSGPGEVAGLDLASYGLTSREEHIVRLVARGRSTRQVSAEIFIFGHTATTSGTSSKRSACTAGGSWSSASSSGTWWRTCPEVSPRGLGVAGDGNGEQGGEEREYPKRARLAAGPGKSGNRTRPSSPHSTPGPCGPVPQYLGTEGSSREYASRPPSRFITLEKPAFWSARATRALREPWWQITTVSASGSSSA